MYSEFAKCLYCGAKIIKRVQEMVRSKLEMYVDVLGILIYQGPMTLTHLVYRASISYRVLKRFLTYLLTEQLIQERKMDDDRVIYTITQKGITTFKCFRKLKQVLPVLQKEKPRGPLI